MAGVKLKCSGVTRWAAGMMCLTLLLSSSTMAEGGWVIKRDEHMDSPLLKDRKAVAMVPEQQEQQVLVAAYQQALQVEQQKIREHWPNAEVSSQSRWVAYSPDYATKRVVDFARNQIEISIDGIYAGSRLDFAAMGKKVQSELEDTLATTLKKALNQDPIQVAMHDALVKMGGSNDPIESGADLVLDELFSSRHPSQSDIRIKAAAMMRNASIRYQALSASLVTVPVNTGRKLTYVIPLPDNRIRRKVLEYKPLVERNAERFSLSEDVIMAIIHTESHFNPLARSSVPAFGLMQIVPSTAGRDATAKLGRHHHVLTARYLYAPKHNIEIGAAYLNVLYYDYLKDIKNPQSRLYYTIASYNAGPSSVALAFVDKPSFQDAVDEINRMSPQQVLERIMQHAPREETRQYVEKVLKRRNYYAKL